HAIKQDVLLKVIEIIQQNNAEFAYPTSTMHLQTVPQQAAMLGDNLGNNPLKNPAEQPLSG
ncbi:hypothetical protein MNBD_GAMMA10-1900, partial [hydrothermal vent metagenome]